jgi:hypothetical protein
MRTLRVTLCDEPDVSFAPRRGHTLDWMVGVGGELEIITRDDNCNGETLAVFNSVVWTMVVFEEQTKLEAVV